MLQCACTVASISFLRRPARLILLVLERPVVVGGVGFANQRHTLPVKRHAPPGVHKRTHNVAQHAPLVQAGVHKGDDLGLVPRRQVVPMHRWHHVVHRVEPIVKCQQIRNGTDKVARHVVVPRGGSALRPRGARNEGTPVVLQKVHCNNAPLRKQVREVEECEGAAPICACEDTGDREHGRPLEHALPEEQRAAAPGVAQILDVEAKDVGRNERLEEEHVECVAAKPHLARAHGVALALRVAVVAQVVPRVECRSGVPVRERQRNEPGALEARAVKDTDVDGVVCDARRSKGKVRQQKAADQPCCCVGVWPGQPRGVQEHMLYSDTRELPIVHAPPQQPIAARCRVCRQLVFDRVYGCNGRFRHSCVDSTVIL